MSKNCGNSDIVKIYAVQPGGDPEDKGISLYQDGSFILSGVTNLNFINANLTTSGLTTVNVTIDEDTFVTGFTYDNTNTFTLYRNDNEELTVSINILSGVTYYGNGIGLYGIPITGITDLNTILTNKVSDGLSVGGGVPIFSGKSGDSLLFKSLSAGTNTTISDFGDLVRIDVTIPPDTNTFVTGQTFNNSSFILSTSRNDGFIINTDLSVLANDVYVLSGTYDPSTGIVTYTNSSGGTFTVSGFTTGMTDSYTVTSYLSGTTLYFNNNIQGNNFYSVDLLPILSGKTDLTTFLNYTANTKIELDSKLVGGSNVGFGVGVLSGESSNTLLFKSLSAGTNTTISDLGNTIKIDVSIPPDTNTFVTGGTYDSNSNLITLTRNDGFDVVISGVTDSFVTGATFSSNTLTLSRNEGLPNLMVDLSSLSTLNSFVTGGTYNTGTTSIDFTGNVGFNPFSVNVSQLLDDTNIYLTAFTFDNIKTFTITRNDGQVFSTSINTLSGITYYGDGSNLTGVVGEDNFVSGGTYNSITKNIEFYGTNPDTAFNVSLSAITSTSGDTFVIDGYLSGDTLTLQRNDGVNIDITGFTSTPTLDIYTTGVTLNGNLLVFNRTDSLSAYTVDLSSITVNSSGSTIIFSDTEPNPSIYSGNTWVRTTDYEHFIYDVNRVKWLTTNTNEFEGSRSRPNQTDIFLRTVDGAPYNLVPYYLPKNSTITSVVGSNETSNTFKILVLTGTTLSTDVIYELPIISSLYAIDNNANVDIPSETPLYLYMSGNTIDRPKATVYYKNR